METTRERQSNPELRTLSAELRVPEFGAQRPAPPAPRPSPRLPRSLGLALAGLLLLHLSHPLTWGCTRPALWFPPAGLGLALIAWFGPRAALLVLLDGLLVALQAHFLRHPAAPGVGMLAADALLGAAELSLAWWAYRRRACGARSLGDPRSAMLFLFVVPGVVVGAFAALRVLMLAVLDGLPALDGAPGTPARWLAIFWLEHALGLLTVAAPLLVFLTPWLQRRGLLRPERSPHAVGSLSATADEVSLGQGAPSLALTWGDWLETLGLAAGASVLNVLLARLYGRHELAAWQLWGAPLLLIVWASLRQSLRGGTLVAAAAAALPFLVLPVRSYGHVAALLLQANLLAQCGTALLVAVSVGWLRVRENRYQQVVSHLPVLIYSARFTGVGRPPSAEVTLVSPASAGILGVDPEELLGDYDQWLERVHPDDREVLHAALAQLGRQDEPVTCEYRLAESKGGERETINRSSVLNPQSSAFHPPARWVRDTLAPHRDAAGQLTGWEGVVTDITEQRALADDLRRTSTMFHALVSNLPTGVVFVQGKQGQPILVNARARQLLGQREDLGANLERLPEAYHLFRPDGSPYPAEELPVYLALRRGRTTMRDDIVVHRADGRRIALMSWAAPVSLARPAKAGSGPREPDSAVWVLEDWTALHQAEAARRDTESRLRAVLSTMAEGLLVQSPAGQILDCNPAAGTLLGCEPDHLRGRKLSDLDLLILNEDGELLPEDSYPAQTVVRTGEPVRNRVLCIRPLKAHHGRGPAAAPGPEAAQDLSSSWMFDSQSAPVRWVLANALPLPSTDPNGKQPAGQPLRGVVTTLSDISAYAQARQTLQASEERYRGLIESLPLMVLQGDLSRRLTYANPATRDVTGYELVEIADPAAWQRFVHPEDFPRLEGQVAEALAGREGRVTFRYTARDGSEKVAYAMVQPCLRDGVVAGTTTLLVDMTRERRLEQDLQRAQRLELIGRLSSGIAHDFNNLLNVVLSLTDLARSNLPADHPVHADLRRITEAGQQAAGLANQLLALSKQRPAAAARRIEVNRVVRRTLELLRATLPARIELEPTLDDVDLFVRADETQMQQVVMNLCLNARDAMPGGGHLRVRTARPAKDEVLLSVQDDGVGMTEDTRARAFDSFFTTKERGTGLGLAMVQQIVEASGGRVEVSSQPGCGARFDVYWPASTG